MPDAISPAILEPRGICYTYGISQGKAVCNMCPVNAMGLRSFRLTMENGVRVVRLVHTNAMMLCFDRPDLEAARSYLDQKTGVYFLQNENRLYIGMSDTLFQRLNNHLSDQYAAYWARTWVFLTSDNILTGDEAKELERKFADLIREGGRFELCTQRVSYPNLHMDYRISADIYFRDFCLLTQAIYAEILLPQSREPVLAPPPAAEPDPQETQHSLGEFYNPTFRRLCAFSLFDGPKQPAASWRNLLVALCEEMIRRGHDLSALPPTVLRPQPFPMGTAQKTLSNGLYLNVNLSAQSVLDHCHKILAAYRYPDTQVRYWTK